MSKYDAKIRHMERNLYKEPTSHRGNYLKIGKHKHQSRECHTHSRTQTDTHSIQLVLCLSLHQSQRALISTGNSMLREQHANATEGQAHCCSVSHEHTIGLSSSETRVEINRCFKTNIYCKHTLLDKHTCM